MFCVDFFFFFSFLLLCFGLSFRRLRVQITAERARGLLEQEGCLSARGLTPDAVLQLASDSSWLSIAKVVEELLHGGFVEVLVEVVAERRGVAVVRDDDHGRVDAAAHALHLADGEEAVRGGAVHGHAEVVLGPVDELVAAAEHARRGDAELDVVLADGLAVVHGVEGGDLEDGHGRDLADLGDLVHGGDGDPAAVLDLGEVEEGEHAGSSARAGEGGHDDVDLLVRLHGEVPRHTRVVALGVLVAHFTAEGTGSGNSSG